MCVSMCGAGGKKKRGLNKLRDGEQEVTAQMVTGVQGMGAL